MPVSTSREDGVVFVRCWGDHAPEEIREAGRGAIEDATTSAKAPVLLDVSESASLRGRGTSTLLESARILAERSDVIDKVAIVAPDDLLFGLMRMAAAFSESHGLDTQVFRSADTAKEWLRGEL